MAQFTRCSSMGRVMFQTLSLLLLDEVWTSLSRKQKKLLLWSFVCKDGLHFLSILEKSATFTLKYILIMQLAKSTFCTNVVVSIIKSFVCLLLCLHETAKVFKIKWNKVKDWRGIRNIQYSLQKWHIIYYLFPQLF